jgi:uncharacterized protein (DUF58 family)
MSGSGVRATFDELVALRLRAAELLSGVRRRAHEPRGGALHSPFRGRGMEYAESRPYSPGDDARHVDWRVSARTGTLHSKLFHAERERVSAVVVDASPHMAFGTRVCFKSVQAARLAALFAWYAQALGDRLAGARCGAEPGETPPCGGRRGVLRLLERLVTWQAVPQASASAARTPLSGCLQRLQTQLRPGSHVLLAVDASMLDEAAMQRLATLRLHHDLLVALVVDPLEMHAPPPGRYPVVDADGEHWLDLLDTPSRERWQLARQRVWRGALQRLRGLGIAARPLRTDDDPLLALRDLLRGAVYDEAA